MSQTPIDILINAISNIFVRNYSLLKWYYIEWLYIGTTGLSCVNVSSLFIVVFHVKCIQWHRRNGTNVDWHFAVKKIKEVEVFLTNQWIYKKNQLKKYRIIC